MANAVPSRATTMEEKSIPKEADDYLESIVLTEEEKEAIQQMSANKKFSKGTILLREGEFPSKCYYVLKGCVRQYTLKNGEEKTTFFFTEGQAVFSNLNPDTRSASKHFLECVEDCELSTTTKEQEEEMYKRFPRFEAMCRASTEKQFEEFQDMFATFVSSSPEERYLHLIDTRPELLQRVPHYQLASYLGVKPESLSRIRKRISQKKKN